MGYDINNTTTMNINNTNYLSDAIKNLSDATYRLEVFENHRLYDVNLHLHPINSYEITTTGYSLNFLDFVSLISVLLTIAVIISRNPVVSILFLIGLFFSIACYLMLLGLDFIGLSYLLVYVGAVSILFLFILMLINVRISELATESTNSLPLVITIAMLFSYSVRQTFPVYVHTSSILIYLTNNMLPSYLQYNVVGYFSDKLSNSVYITSKVWDGYLAETTHIASIGSIMYTNYSMWLIITSIILLLAMVGTIVITIKNTSDITD